jgi:hypothetical protein
MADAAAKSAAKGAAEAATESAAKNALRAVDFTDLDALFKKFSGKNGIDMVDLFQNEVKNIDAGNLKNFINDADLKSEAKVYFGKMTPDEIKTVKQKFKGDQVALNKLAELRGEAVKKPKSAGTSTKNTTQNTLVTTKTDTGTTNTAGAASTSATPPTRTRTQRFFDYITGRNRKGKKLEDAGTDAPKEKGGRNVVGTTLTGLVGLTLLANLGGLFGRNNDNNNNDSTADTTSQSQNDNNAYDGSSGAGTLSYGQGSTTEGTGGLGNLLGAGNGCTQVPTNPIACAGDALYSVARVVLKALNLDVSDENVGLFVCLMWLACSGMCVIVCLVCVCVVGEVL